MTHIVLVHGGQHGSWCWRRLRQAIQIRGLTTSAPDLPIEDTSAGAMRYAEVIVRDIQDRSEPVMLVGHSMGGLVIPVVATLRPVRRMVFLSGLLPVPQVAFSAVVAAEPGASRYPTERNLTDAEGRHVVPWRLAREVFYSDCEESVARECWLRLRPQARLPFDELCPLKSWPMVDLSLIVGRSDPAMDLDWSRANAAKRFGKTLIELEGGHSLFLSNTDNLADVLTELALLG